MLCGLKEAQEGLKEATDFREIWALFDTKVLRYKQVRTEYRQGNGDYDVAIRLKYGLCVRR